jgi:hypothetical protein
MIENGLQYLRRAVLGSHTAERPAEENVALGRTTGGVAPCSSDGALAWRGTAMAEIYGSPECS